MKKEPKKKALLLIEFGRSERIDAWPPIERKHGGCGIMSMPEPYDGPRTIVLERHTEAGDRVFYAVRVDRAPSGHCFGTFRIDEDVRGGERITHGYHLSYPSYEVALRLAQESDDARRKL